MKPVYPKNIKSEFFIENVQCYDIDPISNEVYLMPVDWSEESDTGVDVNMANVFIKNMNLCRKINPGKPVVIHMDTKGGDWDQGLAIYDCIKLYPHPVTILNYTAARSMSSIIMQAANKKLTMPHGTFMLHDGTMNVNGTVKQVMSSVKWTKKDKETMLEIYCNSMAEKEFLKNNSERKRWLNRKMDQEEDVWFTADEAIEIGFFDAKFNGDYNSLTRYTRKELRR